MTNLVVRVVGADRPGITAGLMSIIEAHGAVLQDAEQVLVRQRLILAVAVGTTRPDPLLRVLEGFADESGLTVDVEHVAEPSDATPTVDIVTVLAPTISARAFGRVAGAIGSVGANIERIVRLARYPVYCYEFRVGAADGEALRAAVGPAAAEEGLDVAVQRETLGRRAMRLVAFDVDSTLIGTELIDEAAAALGCGDEVAAVTSAAMAGELDFEAALRERVALLRGLPASKLDELAERVEFTPGARTLVTTLKRLGFTVVAFSGGFSRMTDIVGRRLGLDATYANRLEVVDGVVTGRLEGRVVDRDRKGELLSEVAERAGVPLAQTVAVGDGANDLEMLTRAGLGIAFNAKQVVREAADTAISVPYLDVVLFLLGVGRDDVEREHLTRRDPPATAGELRG